jgi:hypothetical protein
MLLFAHIALSLMVSCQGPLQTSGWVQVRGGLRSKEDNNRGAFLVHLCRLAGLEKGFESTPAFPNGLGWTPALRCHISKARDELFLKSRSMRLGHRTLTSLRVHLSLKTHLDKLCVFSCSSSANNSQKP